MSSLNVTCRARRKRVNQQGSVQNAMECVFVRTREFASSPSLGVPDSAQQHPGLTSTTNILLRDVLTMLACPIPHNKWRNICLPRYRESNKQSFSFRILLARGVELVRFRPLLLNRVQFATQVSLHLPSVRRWRALTGNKLWLTSNIVNLRSTCLWYGRDLVYLLRPHPHSLYARQFHESG